MAFTFVLDGFKIVADSAHEAAALLNALRPSPVASKEVHLLPTGR
jgi:hypothetical protein